MKHSSLIRWLENPFEYNSAWNSVFFPNPIVFDADETLVDISKDNSAAYIKIAVPGFKKNELAVEVKSPNTLEISGKSKTESPFITSSVFKRAWSLHDSHDTTKISSKLEDGILTVTVPFKTIEKKPDERHLIEIQ